MTKLDVDNNKISGKALGDLLIVVPVRKLHLVRNKLTDSQCSPIRDNLLSTKNLKFLYMGHNNISDKGLGMLSGGIQANTGIEELSFTHNILRGESGIKFAKCLGYLYNLRKLSLNSCMMDIDVLEEMKDSLLETESLTDLNLYANDIDAEGARILSQCLANKKNLRILGLSNNMIGHGGAREMADCLSKLTSLTRLALENNLISNLGLQALSKALVDNESLQEIFLYNNDLDDDILPEFSSMLGNKSNLTTLGLEYNRIRSRGAISVFNSLLDLPKFERFFISHNLLDADVS